MGEAVGKSTKSNGKWLGQPPSRRKQGLGEASFQEGRLEPNGPRTTGDAGERLPSLAEKEWAMNSDFLPAVGHKVRLCSASAVLLTMVSPHALAKTDAPVAVSTADITVRVIIFETKSRQALKDNSGVAVWLAPMDNLQRPAWTPNGRTTGWCNTTRCLSLTCWSYPPEASSNSGISIPGFTTRSPFRAAGDSI
jgi:hypothetical protein